MRTIYSCSIEALGNIGTGCQPPPTSKLDKVPTAFNLVASALSEILARRSIPCSAVRSHPIFKHVVSHAGDITSPELLKKTHSVLLDSRVPSRFRLHDLSIGAGRPSSGFLTARIDVNQHIIQACKYINAHHYRHRRVLAMMYAVAVIHPFEDGNGRLMRTMAPIIGCRQNRTDLTFWLYFSLHAKVNEIRFIDAIQRLHDGCYEQISEFYLDACSEYEEFSRFLLSISLKEIEDPEILTRFMKRKITDPRFVNLLKE